MPAAKLAAIAPGPPSALPVGGMLATMLLPAFSEPMGFTCIPTLLVALCAAHALKTVLGPRSVPSDAANCGRRFPSSKPLDAKPSDSRAERTRQYLARPRPGLIGCI